MRENIAYGMDGLKKCMGWFCSDEELLKINEVFFCHLSKVAQNDQPQTILLVKSCSKWTKFCFICQKLLKINEMSTKWTKNEFQRKKLAQNEQIFFLLSEVATTKKIVTYQK